MRPCYVAIAVLAAACSLPAQDTRGAISGTITDAQGATVVGARVTVTNTDRNTLVTLTTNPTGFYDATLLDPGNYRVSAEAGGFKKFVRAGIVVALAEKVDVNIRMEIGATSESITVTSESPILQTDSASTGRSLTAREILDLPVMSNNITMQATLAAGVATNGISQYTTEGQITGTSNAYFAPGGVGGNEWSIDGAPNDGKQRQLNFTPSTDSVEEFKVETSNFDASLGHSTGLSLSVQTKAGTNAYHGTVTDSYWNTRFNAAGFYQKQAYYTSIAAANAAGNTALANQIAAGPTTPGGHSNNYAGTIGGPVRIPKVLNGKNKLFFFLAYTGAKDRQPARPSDINYIMPTAAQKTGNFSELLALGTQYTVYDPLTVQADPTRPGHFVRIPFANNTLPASRVINPAYSLLNKVFPLPNTVNGPATNNYIATCQVDNLDSTAYDQRTDYQPNQSNRLTVRWSYSTFLESYGDFTCTGLQSFDDNRHSKSAVATWTHTFNSSTVLDISASATSFIQRNKYGELSTYKPSDVGLPTYVDDYCKARGGCALPVFTVSGYNLYQGSSVGRPAVGYPYDRTVNMKANLSHIRGLHTITSGLDFRDQIHSDSGSPGAASGSFNFANTYVRKDDDGNAAAASIGLSWASLMLGLPTTTAIDNNSAQTLSNPYFGWFAQDSWRIHRNLTISYGLRMEFEKGMKDRFDRMITGFDPTAQLPIAAGAQAAYAANLASYQTTASTYAAAVLPASAFQVVGGNQYAGANGASRQLWNDQLMFLPRVSAAWHFSPKMVLRGGYGTFYDSLNANNEGVNQGGFSRTTTDTVSDDFGQTWNLGNPAGGVSPLKDPFPIRADGTRYDLPYGNTIGAMYQTGRGFTYGDPNRRHAEVQKWRAGVQRQLSSNIVVEAAYWGQWGSDIGVTQNQSTLPGSFYNTTEVRNVTPGNILNANVTNPFYIGNFAAIQKSNPNLYQVMSSQSFYTSKTIALNRLMVPFPQMNGLSESGVPLGRDKINALELNFTKRLSHGLNLNASYTWLRGKDKTSFNNPYDSEPTWLPANSSTPRRLTISSIYEFPLGKGKAWLKTGLLGQVLGGWQVSGTYQYQPGSLLTWGNLFYYGDLSTIGNDLRNVTNPSINNWFNTTLPFEKNSANVAAAYQARVFPQVIDGVRGDKESVVNADFARNFKVSERAKLQIRIDALNLQNRTQFSNPGTDPTNANTFGKVSGQTSSINRFYQMQARLQF